MGITSFHYFALRFAIPLVVLMVDTKACGVSTHISIAHEASYYMSESTYEQIVKANQDAFVAGNPFPDFAYAKQCFNYKYHDVSEATHWAPFLNATINYIRKKYKRPWNQQAQKLIAFTFGFVSHQVADVSWHSLGIDQGFIRAMANVNFHAVFSDAHGTADVGGDMMSQLEADDSPINQFQWFIPSTDLSEIYKEYYGKEMITQDIIEECSTLLFLAWLGEKIAGAKLFKRYAKKSPFLHQKLHNYFLGGVHDMASWTNEIWQHAETMLEHGTEACQVPKNTLFIKCNKTDITRQPRIGGLRNPGKPYQRVHHNLTYNDVIRKRTKHGMILFPKQNTFDLIRIPRVDALNKYQREFIADDGHGSPALRPYSETGRFVTIAHSETKGPSLIYGAPNYNLRGSPQIGQVYIVNISSISTDGATHPINLQDLEHEVLQGPERMGKFGWDVAILDINKDGIDDVAVSAPSQGSKDLKYFGAVHFYFGRKNGGYHNTADLILHGNTTFENFGFSLLAADLNNDGYKDLVIGSPFAGVGGPQRGRVDVVMAASNIGKIGRVVLATGSHDYQWFGYSLEFIKIKEKSYVLVGSPAYRECAEKDCSYSPSDIQEKGRVFVYDVSYPNTKLISTLSGPGAFSEFGSSLAVGSPFGTTSDPMVAVGASSHDVQGHLIDMVPKKFTQAGTVFLFNFTAILSMGINIQNEALYLSNALVTSFSGDRDYGHFGTSVKFRDTNGDGVQDLIIGAPFRTKDLTEEIIGAESGSLYIFNGGHNFPTGDATANCGSIFVQPCPDLKASRSLHGTEFNARFGTSFDVFKNFLFTSSPRSSHKAFHSGAIQMTKLT